MNEVPDVTDFTLRYFGDPVLEEKCEPVTALEQIPPGLIPAMRRVMSKAEGVGLAAPQVGCLVAVALIKVNGQLVAAVNPRLEEASKATRTAEEGCLSLPNFFLPVKRARSIRIWYQDEKLIPYSRRLVGFEARIAQHEIDHLAGITIVTGQPRNIRGRAEHLLKQYLKKQGPQ